MLSGADVWQLRARENKEASPLASFSRFLPFFDKEAEYYCQLESGGCPVHFAHACALA